MRRVLLALAVLGVACGGKGSLVVVGVDAATPLLNVARLTVGVTAAGKSRVFTVHPATSSIPPAAVFGIQFDPGVTGNVAIHVEALDGSGASLGTGDGSGPIAAGATARIDVALGGGMDMGVVDMSAPPDLAAPDLATRDLATPDLAMPDLIVPPDLLPPPFVIAAPPFLIAGATGQTAQVPPQPGATYTWTISGGTIVSGSSTNAITFSAGAMGTLMLTCTASNGKMANLSLDVYSSADVTSLADSGANTLRQAILNANAAVAGNYRIGITVSGTITLASALPALNNTKILIDGPGASMLTVSGNNQFVVFFSTAGTTTLRNLTVANGLAKGGNGGGGALGGGGAAGLGGGLFVNGGTAVIDGVTFSGNVAKGGTGAGTAGNVLGEGGGGGGGFGGDGTTTSAATGGAGGPGGLLGAAAQGGTGGDGSSSANGTKGGDGGFGAGGGGGGNRSPSGTGQNGGNGGNGGFGGGAGGAYNGGTAGTAGTFGGSAGAGGGGGAGLGGALFIRSGTITFNNVTFSGNTATGGTASAGAFSGGAAGKGKAGAAFLNAGVTATHTGTLTFTNNSASDAAGMNTDNNDVYGTIN
jgi:hypothetical protein